MMIIVVTRTNKNYLMKNGWANLKLDSEIKELILTDANNIQRHLSGFDYYSAKIDAMALYGEGVSAHYIDEETIYGVRDLSALKKELYDEYTKVVSNIIMSNRDVEKRTKRCRERYETFLNQLNKKEVVSFSFRVVSNHLERKNLPEIKEPLFKKGISQTLSTDDVLGKKWKQSFKAVTQ